MFVILTEQLIELNIPSLLNLFSKVQLTQKVEGLKHQMNRTDYITKQDCVQTDSERTLNGTSM